MKKKIFIIVAIILVLIAIAGTILIFKKDKNKEDKEDKEYEEYNKEIAVFSYNYGSSSTGYKAYLISVENGKTYISQWHNDNESLGKEIDQSVLSDISKIVRENKIYEWNGFNEFVQEPRK